MKKIRITAIIISCLLITAYLFFINDVAINIRLSELKTSLQNLDRNERSIDHIGLIATYELHKKIYENRFTQEKADSIEYTIDSLAVIENDNQATIQTEYGIFSLPAIWIINFNRKILGKESLKYNKDQGSSFDDLDIAYYYERNYLFKQALALYEKALSGRMINDTLRASILLHQGYCYALSGFNELARKNYLTITDNYPQESSAVTAAILLRYLEGFQAAREQILSSSADAFSASRDLVNLLAYKQALKILQEEETKANPKDIPMIKYFMARCFAGMGKPGKAAENYIHVITLSPSSRYARYSNRKLFLIGSRLGDKNIIKMTKQLNDKLDDPVLSQMIQDQNEIRLPVTDKFIKVDIPQKIIEKVDTFSKDAGKKSSGAVNLLINTSDGSTFKGTLIEQTDTDVSILSSIGKITIKKNKITSMTETE